MLFLCVHELQSSLVLTVLCLFTSCNMYFTLTEAPNISTRRSCEETRPQYFDNSLLTALYLSSLLRSKPYFVGVDPSRWTTIQTNKQM